MHRNDGLILEKMSRTRGPIRAGQHVAHDKFERRRHTSRPLKKPVMTHRLSGHSLLRSQWKENREDVRASIQIVEDGDSILLSNAGL
jgi:hypothetical protein